MRVVLFSKFTAQTGCSVNAPSGLPVKGPCSARCFGENGGFWADMGAGVPLTGLGGSDFLPSGINTQPLIKQQASKETSRRASCDCVSVRVHLRVLYRLGQTHARHSGGFICVAQLPKRMMGRRMHGQGVLSLEALGVCLAQPGDFSAYIVLIQVVIHRPAGN